MITVRVKDFHGNARCDLELRDVVTGTVVDIGELNEQTDSVTLQPQGRTLVYLVNDACGVQVLAGLARSNSQDGEAFTNARSLRQLDGAPTTR